MALGSQLAEFFAKISFDVEDKKLKDVDSKLVGVTNRMQTMQKVAAGLAVAFQQVVSFHFANITAEEQKFAKLNGVLNENVDAWKLMATQANVSEGTVTSALSSIAKQKQDLMTMRSIPMWIRFGVDPKQSPDKILQSILNKVKSFTNDTQKQMAMLNRLGINSELVLMFENGSLAIDEATQKIIEFKSQNADISTELVKNANVTKMLFKNVMQGLNGLVTPIMNVVVKFINIAVKEIAVILIPALSKVSDFVKKIADFMMKVYKNFEGVFKWLFKVLGLITLVIGALFTIKTIISSFMIVANVIPLLLKILNISKSIAVIQGIITGLLASPIVILGSIIALVVLLWKKIAPESFNKFLRGIKLILTDIMDFISGIPNTVTGDVIDIIKLNLEKFFEWVKSKIDAVAEWINKIAGWIDKLNEKLSFMQGINNKIGQAEDWLGAKMKSGVEKVKSGFNTVGDFFDGGLVGTSKNIHLVRENLLREKNMIPKEQIDLNRGTTNSVRNNKVDNKITNNINITTESGRPNDIAQTVSDKLKSMKYQTSINDELETASLSLNVQAQGAY
jgi:hypothetical protein